MPKSAQIDKAKPLRTGSAYRCLELLETLALDPFTFSLAEIARIHSLPKSSAHRLLKLLIDSGFVEMDPATRWYALSPKVLWIGSSYLRRSALQRSAHLVLPQLAFQCGTMSHLGIWDDRTVLILQSADPPNAASLFVDVGERRPVHATALGKILLAYRSPASLEEICRGGLTAYTPHTITTASALEEELQRVREAGIATDNEEYSLGLRCIAAPVRSQEGVIGALGISGSLDLIPAESVPRLAQNVQDAALRVSALMGYRPLTARVDFARFGRGDTVRSRPTPEDTPKPAPSEGDEAPSRRVRP